MPKKRGPGRPRKGESRRGPGRPRKKEKPEYKRGYDMLTPTVLEKITNAIVAGLPATFVPPFAGIAKQTFSDWLKRGAQAIEAELEGREVPESEKPYMELSNQVDKAVSILALRCLKTINQATEGIRNDDGTFAIAPSWQAAMTLLERRLPEHFGRKDRIEHTGDANSPVVVSTLAEFVLNAAKKHRDTEDNRRGSN